MEDITLIQTEYGVQPDSFSISIWRFQIGRDVKLNTHPYLAFILRMPVAMPPSTPSYDFMTYTVTTVGLETSLSEYFNTTYCYTDWNFWFFFIVRTMTKWPSLWQAHSPRKQRHPVLRLLGNINALLVSVTLFPFFYHAVPFRPTKCIWTFLWLYRGLQLNVFFELLLIFVNSVKLS